MNVSELRAIMSQIQRRIDALKRGFAREFAIIKARRIAEAAPNRWNPAEPLDPLHVGVRFAKAGCHANAFGNLHEYRFETIRKGEQPNPFTMVRKIFPYAWDHRYDNFFAFDLPPDPSIHPAIPDWCR